MPTAAELKASILANIPSGTPGAVSAADVRGELNSVVDYLKDKLTADRTYYVRTDGNDANTGLANTAGGAWLTPDYAREWIAQNIDFNNFRVTVEIADGTYPGVSSGKKLHGGGTLWFKGNHTTPANVILDGTTLTCAFETWNNNYDDTAIYVSGMTLKTLYSTCVATFGGRLYLGSPSFDGSVIIHSAASFAYLISAQGQNAYVGFNSPNTIVSVDTTVTPVQGLIQTNDRGRVTQYNTTFVNIPNWTTAGINVGSGCTVQAQGSFTGTATGKKFIVSYSNSLLVRADLSTLPGSIDGTWSYGFMPDAVGGMSIQQQLTMTAPAALTASAPGLTINQTWNNAAVVFSAAKIDVTSTVSAAQSKLLDLRLAGVAKAAISKSGGLRTYGAWTDDSNFEYGELLGFTSGTWLIASRAGTGVMRPLVFSTSGQAAWIIGADTAGGQPNWGHWVPLLDNLQDIGGTDRDATLAIGTFRPRDLYLGRTAYLGHFAPAAVAATTVDSAALGTGTGTLTISDATNWPSRGYINVEAETMWYSSRAGNVLTIQFRGSSFTGGGTPVVHADGVAVRPGLPISVSTPAINVGQIWNNSAVAFTAIEANITSVASAFGSKLMDLKRDGLSRFSVRRDGTTMLGSSNTNGAILFPSDKRVELYTYDQTGFAGLVASQVYTTWASERTTDVNAIFIEDGWNNASIDFKAFRMNITDTSSGANSKLMDLQVGGVSKMSVKKDGSVVAPNVPGAVTVSTSAPSGGNDGDVWYQVV